MIQDANLHWRYMDSATNLIMPWYTLPALKWLTSQNVKDWNVFEYGSGYSTIWWRLNCKHIVSVDNIQDWSIAMSTYFGYNREVYINKINETRENDCIIVDGEYREDCVVHCLPFLKSGGALIIDNYDSENYDKSQLPSELLTWKHDIYQQPNHSFWKTAIFIKP